MEMVLDRVMPRLDVFEAMMGNIASMVETLTRRPDDSCMGLVRRRLVGVSRRRCTR